MKSTTWACTAVMGALLLGGCETDGVTGSGAGGDPLPANNPTPVTISGAAYKGPLVLGSPIVAERLDRNGKSTGEVHVTKTTNDLGSFSIAFDDAGFAKLFATGYHFNEFTGELEGPITLNGILDATGSTNVKAYVNVLTHLIFDRVLNLVESGMGGKQAISQSQSELVSALSSFLPTSMVPNFSAATLFNDSASSDYANAYLLALSATLAKYSQTPGDLTLVLNSLAVDLSDNGLIDASDVIDELGVTCRSLIPEQIRDNLQDYAAKVGRSDIVVADISLFVDTDGDGIVNSEDPNDDNDAFPDDVDDDPYVPFVFNPNGGVYVAPYSIFASFGNSERIGKVELFINDELVGVATAPDASDAFRLYEWNSYFWTGIQEFKVTAKIWDSSLQFVDIQSWIQGTDWMLVPSFYTTPWIDVTYSDTNTPAMSWEFDPGINPGRDIDFIAQSEIEIWNVAAPEVLVVSEVIDGSNFIPPKLANGTYAWRVRCANSEGAWGRWDHTKTFTIAVK